MPIDRSHASSAVHRQLKLLSNVGIEDAFLTKQKCEYNANNNTSRLHSRYIVPGMGTVLVSTIMDLADGGFVSEKVELYEGERRVTLLNRGSTLDKMTDPQKFGANRRVRDYLAAVGIIAKQDEVA